MKGMKNVLKDKAYYLANVSLMIPALFADFYVQLNRNQIENKIIAENSGSFLPVIYGNLIYNVGLKITGAEFPVWSYPVFLTAANAGAEILQKFGIIEGVYDTKDIVAGSTGGLVAYMFNLALDKINKIKSKDKLEYIVGTVLDKKSL